MIPCFRIAFILFLALYPRSAFAQLHAYRLRTVSPYCYNPIGMVDFHGTLLFGATDNLGRPTSGCELWRSDGTAEGTAMVRDINEGSATGFSGGSKVFGNTAFFAGIDSVNGCCLWRTDGTSAGTSRVCPVKPSYVAWLNQKFYSEIWANLGGDLLFPTDPDALWRTDGALSGTRLVNWLPKVEWAAASGGLIFYLSTKSSMGQEIWRSDGTSDGTYMLLHQPNIYFMDSMGGRLFMGVADQKSYPHLWTSDGTIAGTHEFKFINPDGPSCVMNDEFFFFANEWEFSHYQEKSFWKTDGTASGTVKLVSNLWYIDNMTYRDPPRYGTCGRMIVMGGLLYFTAWDDAHGEELWRTDGTPQGTVLVTDIVPGSAGSFPSSFALFRDRLFFIINNNEIWCTDGSAVGTMPVVKPCPDGEISSLTPCGDILFFAAYKDSPLKYELWALGPPDNAARHWTGYE